MPPRIFSSIIQSSQPVMGDAKLITITVPESISREAKAGNCVRILCREPNTFDPMIRRPFSVMRANPSSNEIAILVRPYGRGSGWLDAQPNGTTIDVLGLLGNNYSVNSTTTNLLMVAGGVGAAPLVMLAEEAIANGLNVT